MLLSAYLDGAMRLTPLVLAAQIAAALMLLDAVVVVAGIAAVVAIEWAIDNGGPGW